MDKQTTELLVEAEREILEAESVTSVASDDDLARAIKHAYLVGQDSSKLEQRRKEKNAKAQETVKRHTAIFKPLMDRAERAREKLRQSIFEYLAPGGSLGNMDPDEVRSFGEDGLGVASIARVQAYEYDLVELARNHPELLKVDDRAVAAKFKAGETVRGATPTTKLQLRIT